MANIIAVKTDSEHGTVDESEATQCAQASSTSTEPDGHPPSLPQAGPHAEHTKAMTSAISEKLAEESVSSIPPTANGHAHAHGEVFVASDTSKGLAIEAEKLSINEKSRGHGHGERPSIERFVTAKEV